MKVIKSFVLVFALLLCFEAQASGPYDVGCSNLLHDPDKVAAFEAQGWDMQILRSGTISGAGKIYIDQVLAPEAEMIQLQVPDKPELYGAESGESIKLALVFCYPTGLDNANPDYQPPGSETIIPKMQTGNNPYHVLQGEQYPLIIVSHGLYMDPLDERLFNIASHGYVVAAAFHGDGRYPLPTLITLRRIELLSLRPLAISALIDYMLEHPEIGGFIDHSRIGGLGISIGGSSFMASSGAKIIGPDLFSKRSTAIDNRVSAVAGIVPFLGRGSLIFPMFGLDYSGADDVHVPYLSIVAGQDDVADSDKTYEVMNRKQGSSYVINLPDEHHWLSNDAVMAGFDWVIPYFDTYLKGQSAFYELAESSSVLPGPVSNYISLFRPGNPEYYANQTFDMLEALFPEVLSGKTKTMSIDGILYRRYNNEKYLAVYINELYLISNDEVRGLGPLMYWWFQLRKVVEGF